MKTIFRKFTERILYGFGFGLGMGFSWQIVQRRPTYIREKQVKNVTGLTGI